MEVLMPPRLWVATVLMLPRLWRRAAEPCKSLFAAVLLAVNYAALTAER